MSSVSSRPASETSPPTAASPSRGAAPRPALANVLVACDGSAHSERAFEITVRLAKASGSAVEIVTVVPTYPEYNFGPVGGAPPYVPDDEEVRHYREIATRLKGVAEERGIDRVSMDVFEGRPGSLIRSEARARHPDLIVVGGRGMSSTRRVLLGSVSHDVVMGSTSPVLVVRGDPSRPLPPGEPPFDRTVVAVDGSPAAARALALAIEVSHALRLPLRIVTVVPIPTGLGSRESKRTEEQTLAVAQRLVEEGRQQAVRREVADVAVEVLRGTAADAILDYLGEAPSHLLVVGSRGRASPQRLFLGSVSTALLHHAPSSVLVARAAEEGETPAGSAPSRARRRGTR